jgi:AraC-like DNA-binding protein
MRSETVSSGFFSSLLDYAVSKGADRTTLLAHAGADAASLQDRDNRLPFSQYVALMRAAKEATADQALALNFGQAVDAADISIVGLIGQASETMLDGFTQLNRYVRLIADIHLNGADRFLMKRDAHGLWFTDSRPNPNAFPELTESAFSHVVTWSRRSSVPNWIKEVCFTHPRPAYAADYERVFEVTVMFSSDRNAMRMEEDIVAHKLGGLPRYVFGVLTEHADALIKKMEDAQTTRGEVESLLMPILHKGEATMEAIATKLGVSRQTLYRNLKEEGVTFEQVLDELRHRLAVEYMRGQKTSVNETGYLVGFSDPAGFSRAFKRWTGKSPRDFRHAL